MLLGIEFRSNACFIRFEFILVMGVVYCRQPTHDAPAGAEPLLHHSARGLRCTALYVYSFLFCQC